MIAAQKGEEQYVKYTCNAGEKQPGSMTLSSFKTAVQFLELPTTETNPGFPKIT